MTKTLRRCHSMVLGLRKRRAPISGFVSPSLASRATWSPDACLPASSRFLDSGHQPSGYDCRLGGTTIPFHGLSSRYRGSRPPCDEGPTYILSTASRHNRKLFATRERRMPTSVATSGFRRRISPARRDHPRACDHEVPCGHASSNGAFLASTQVLPARS